MIDFDRFPRVPPAADSEVCAPQNWVSPLHDALVVIHQCLHQRGGGGEGGGRSFGLGGAGLEELQGGGGIGGEVLQLFRVKLLADRLLFGIGWAAEAVEEGLLDEFFGVVFGFGQEFLGEHAGGFDELRAVEQDEGLERAVGASKASMAGGGLVRRQVV